MCIERLAARSKLKRWSRSKKITLIERENPTWHDLSEEWGKPVLPWREPLAAPGSTQVSPLRCAPVEMTEDGLFGNLNRSSLLTPDEVTC